MKTHTNGFKLASKDMGRQIDSKIIYGTTILHDELYAVTPHFKANILKSVMKQLDIESSVDIPLNTILNYQLGIKVGNNYEYLNYGNYVVYSSEKQEDTNTYKIICYDKMLYSMKQNKDLNITYPITIKNYLIAVANKIGLQVENTTFYNQDMQIPAELYLGLEYTYRDILDEIAQVAGAIICINDNDKIEVRYPNITNDTINEEFLKDVNVKFGQKYGSINSIVLSRAGESDNVYLRDEQSVAQNGLCEVKIVDNQIMNFNDRSDYLQGILNALNGMNYYINDFSSTGILYYDVYDEYNITIGENTYNCLMLNDEINVTQGLEELIYTDMPEQSETDYEKADKTDRRINETYLIVDKQNQTIESVVSNVTTQNNKIARVEQTVDEINNKISDIADITTSQETLTGSLTFENINASEPVHIEIRPIENISYLHPLPVLYPANNLYIKLRTLRFTNTQDYQLSSDIKYKSNKNYYLVDDETGEYILMTLGTDYQVGWNVGDVSYDGITIEATGLDIYEYKYWDYELPDDLLYYDNNNYDEFILDYGGQTVYINKKCKYNTSTGAVELLSQERVDEYSFPLIQLTDGNYTVQMLKYDNTPYNCYLFVRLMAQNMYTEQFYTKVQTDSRINQKANEITLGVNQTFTNYSTTNEMNSAINLKANEINSVVSQKVGNNEIISKINQSSESVTINANRINLARKSN